MILSRLGNIITIKDKKKIKKALWNRKKAKPFRQGKQRDLWSSCKLVRTLDKKGI